MSDQFGRKQKIALGALIAPFITTTVALFLGRASFAEWASFNQYLIPIVVGITLGAPALMSVVSNLKKDDKNEKGISVDLGSSSCNGCRNSSVSSE